MSDPHFDAIVIGAGPAGLQAALTLGRMRRTALVLDSGEYRNEPALHMHNFVTHDGTPPAQFRALARKDLDHYDTVTVRETRAVAVRRHDATPAAPAGDPSSPPDAVWAVELQGGDATTTDSVTSRRVLLATGLRDSLPDKPGIADLWGDLVAHCPYCHGHEFTGLPVAILGSSPRVARLSLLLARIASRIVVLTDSGDLDDDTAGQLRAAGVEIRRERVTALARDGAGHGGAVSGSGDGSAGNREGAGVTVTFEQGGDERVGGVFVSTELSQSAPFAEQLGLEMLPSGCVRIDEMGRTSLPGVYAAGDLAHWPSLPMPLASVLNASAAGLLAATAIDQDLVDVEAARIG